MAQGEQQKGDQTGLFTTKLRIKLEQAKDELEGAAALMPEYYAAGPGKKRSEFAKGIATTLTNVHKLLENV
jgi:hypothetical protein